MSNLVQIKGTSRILGSYTLEPRPGLYRNITTLRKTKCGWYNNAGLRNPGINKLNKKGIVSLAGFSVNHFVSMLEIISGNPNVEGVEFNISCPNADIVHVTPEVLSLANQLFDTVIIKVPHRLYLNSLIEIADMGECVLHISNSEKTYKGALSGLSLVDVNLRSIYDLKAARPDLKVIGGGGIYSVDILKEYQAAGADHFSLSSVLFNAYATYKILKWSFKNQEPTKY